MADQAWGKKRICQNCGAAFYDLKKKNIECPQCGAAFSLPPPVKPKRPARLEKKPDPEDTSPIEVPEDNVDPAAKAEDEAGDGAEVYEKDDKFIEDASDLGENDDDMSEVKEHIDDGVEDKN